MGNSLRCCLACVLPCGALDLIRVVHVSGYVEEYGQPVTAKEILEANPNHVISRPCSDQGVTRRIMIVSPDSELKRGCIYFLIPASALRPENRKKGGQKETVEAPPGDRGVRKGEVPAAAEEEGRGGHHRRRSSHVDIWKPHLESIFEG